MIETLIYILSKDEGGRLSPIFNDYRASFKFVGESNQNDFILEIGKDEMLIGGDIHNVIFRPVREDLVNSLINKGAIFEIFEGARLIGKGIIKDIVMA